MNHRKTQTILNRFLGPTILLILLPFLICIAFYLSALQYGYVDALKALQATNAGMLQVLESSSQGDSAQDNGSFSRPSGKQRRSGDNDSGVPGLKPPLRDAVNRYDSLQSPGFIILSENYELLYPSDRNQTSSLAVLAQDFGTAIRNHTLPSDRPFISSDNTKCLVSVLSPDESVQNITYVIAFYPLMQVIGWVKPVTVFILILSAVISLLVLLQLRSSVNKVVRPMKQLCLEAEKISSGLIETISPEFDLKEPEELRISMNNMADELALIQQKREEMVSNAAHKLQNRCMLISSYIQGLMHGFIPPDKAGAFIQKETEALSEDVKNIRSFVSLDIRQAPALQERLPVTEVLENCADRTFAIAVQKGISIRVQKDAVDLFVLGNEDYIEEILDNLLSNAVRYAKKEILLSARRETDNIVVSLADDGDGISEEDMPHIFERFYKGKDGSFGLGLTIARSAAEKMGGTLTAENGENGGAVFTLTLKAG